MAYEVNFKVVNAQVVKIERETTVDGAAATLSFNRAVIEALPLDNIGKTLTLVLPAEALADFPEDAVLTVTVAPKEA